MTVNDTFSFLFRALEINFQKEWGRIPHAWDWCMGMTQREVMGRDVGGGFMFGIACYTRGGFMSMYGKTNTVL